MLRLAPRLLSSASLSLAPLTTASRVRMASTAELSPSKIFSLEGKTALVTGAGTGIGLMCAQALAAAGAKVYITGRRLEALETAAKTYGGGPNAGHGELIPIQGDITDKDSIDKLAKQIEAKEKGLNILVNNAGIAGPTRETEKGDESAQALYEQLWKDEFSDWLDVYKVNVAGAFFTAVRFLPLLGAATEQTRGHSAAIINITSISGRVQTAQHHFAYNASKGAAIQLTSLMAKEFSRPGVKVRCNSIGPGIFPSEMTTDGSDDQQKSHIDGRGYREEKNIPAGRPGSDVDMAQAVVSIACNQYMNGQTVFVDGGYMLGNP